MPSTLAALGVDRAELDGSMIGLRGGPRLADKYAFYLDDMRSVLRECFRVLKRGRDCVIVVGTNNNQLGKVFKVPADQVTGLASDSPRGSRVHRVLIRRGDPALNQGHCEHDAG